MPPKRPTFAGAALETYYLAAFMALEEIAILQTLRDTALGRETATQVPAWLAAEFRSTVSRADPGEPG